MRIGIDIDGVLTNLDQFMIDYFSKFCVENNVDYKIGEFDYNVYKTFGVSEEVDSAFWEEYLEFYAVNEKIRPFASEVIKKLKDDGHEIYIVTARWGANKEGEVGERMRATVKNWLDESGVCYDKLVFSKAAKERKSEEIKEHKIDIMIEDNPNNIAELSQIIPVICYDTSYNKDLVGGNIIRCYSWYDIYKKISEKKF